MTHHDPARRLLAALVEPVDEPVDVDGFCEHGSLGGICREWERKPWEQARAFLATPEPIDVERLREAYRWVARKHPVGDIWPFTVYDHACSECVPDGPLVIEGFQCVPHRAAAYDDAAEAESGA